MSHERPGLAVANAKKATYVTPSGSYTEDAVPDKEESKE